MSITNRRIVNTEGADFYPTPDWATEVLLENEVLKGSIWEPACGTGWMSKVIINRYDDVYSSDLYDRGYGESNIDFLSSNRKVDTIITNPPFNLAEDFIHKAYELASNKICMLLRLSFLESAKRYNTLFSKIPPSRVYVFSERITFYPDGVKTGGSGTTAYAWFVWDKDSNNTNTELKWFQPGFKK